MGDIFEDPQWDTFGLLKEAYLAIETAKELDMRDLGRVSWDLVGLLIRLARSENHQLRPTELGRALSTPPSGITRVIQEAEALGAITREVDVLDGRATQITLTASGHEMARSWAKRTLESLVTHTRDPLSPIDIEKLESMLRTLRDTAQGYCEDRRDSGTYM